jgi:glutaminyl-peptide cyclotransferase
LRRFLALVCGIASLAQAASTPVYGYRIVHAFPHDPAAFTQGLFYLDGFLYEGTGLYGSSTLRKVKLETGEVVERHDLPAQYFGEGIVNWGPLIMQLTWQNGLGLVYRRAGFHLEKTFPYPGEGWGLTQDGQHLIESDGSSSLRYWDPVTFQETRRLGVNDAGNPVEKLNELEFIRGEIYANVWQTDRIARISPSTGRVTSWIDLEGILSPADRTSRVDVLNGIAYDAQRDRLFVTGKLWPKLFEIKLVARSAGATRSTSAK